MDGKDADFMNRPMESIDMAYVKDHGGVLWVHCPYCSKKVFPVNEATTIRNFFFQCKGSKCKKLFEVQL